jgi:hypothetical protein
MVGQVLENVGEDCVQLGDEDSPLSLLYSLTLGLRMLCEGTYGALVGGVQVKGDVLHRVLFGLPLLEFSLVEVPEGNGDDVTGGLCQESPELLLNGLV